MTLFRLIPSIDALLERPALAALGLRHGRGLTADAVRRAAEAARAEITRRAGGWPASEGDVATWIERRAAEDLATSLAPSLRRVINATGVIIHTNLGRAPLAGAARDAASLVSAGYANLEYDVESGERGHRHVHAERRLCELTGAEAALVANNNAAATLVVLAALAAGREVIVSRGELVEIGGGFRVPDVLAQSGAVLREVGTTNRTRLGDYLAAISDRTALILRVHPSNFRIEGFTERPALGDLTALARRANVPVFDDLGSGWLGLDLATPEAEARLRALDDEPSVTAALGAGADLVAFSGDKLLGGPQAGIVLGRRDLVDRARHHPLMRAVRAGKMTYAALDATLALWAQAPARARIPVYRMMTLRLDEIDARARTLVARLEGHPALRCRILDGDSTIGGGSAPGSRLPTRLIALEAGALSASSLEARLRAATPAVIARIHDNRVVIDLRTVAEDEEAALAQAITGSLG